MKVAVLGLGVDTQDVIPYLQNRGDEITVIDEREVKVDSRKYKVEYVTEKRGFGDLSKFDLVIRSPGVYRYRPEIVAAEKAGVEISSKTKLFFDLCPAKIIGVTGTKGKGTTATLIYEILKAAGKDVYLAGNIGSGIFEKLENIGKDSWVVLELSSFQLIDLHKSPHVAVVLMVTSEHLDWHKDTAEYIGAKKNIVSHQKPSDFAVINDDYPRSQEIGDEGQGKKLYFSRLHVVASGCILIQKNIMYRYIEDKEIIIGQEDVRLKGEHNLENIMAAAVVAKMIGVTTEIINRTIKTFKGLEHRLEEVATVNGVTYYNDSFSTTPETAIAAIKAFSRPEIVILGGSSKNSDFSQLAQTIEKASNIKQVILIGIEGERLFKMLKNFKKLEILKKTNMDEIVKTAYNIAKSGDVVLLTPACASFDMFENYKDRGQQFKRAVLQLNEKQNN